jgi:hypothetical protein
MSQTTRKEILERLRGRYLRAGAKHKRKLLDQAQELLGYHRKSAVRALGAPEAEPVLWINAGRPVSYEPSVLLPWLRPIWQASDYACGRRLVAMLPEWIPFPPRPPSPPCGRRPNSKASAGGSSSRSAKAASLWWPAIRAWAKVPR